METAGRVLELVVYKLNAGVSREQFLRTNDAASTWISEQPGFISRDLVYDSEGDRWVDVVWWDTSENARSAATRAMSSTSCAPMFALIELESALMLHGEQVVAPVFAAATAAAP